MLGTDVVTEGETTVFAVVGVGVVEVLVVSRGVFVPASPPERAKTARAPSATAARAAVSSQTGRRGYHDVDLPGGCVDVVCVGMARVSAGITCVETGPITPTGVVGVGAAAVGAVAVTAAVAEPASGARVASGLPRASAIAAALDGRSAGSLARAASITSRTPVGMVTGSGGGAWLTWARAVATAVPESKGRLPVSIS